MWKRRGERLEKMATELLIADSTVDLLMEAVEALTHERDMLARRCAEQAHQIADLISPPLPDDDPHAAVLAAVEVMNRQGIH
jgi:hypothetical protein